LKQEPRSVRNHEELLGWLREVAEDRALRFAGVPSEGSLKEQVALLASAVLLVASSSASHVAGLFLPAGAALLVLPACAAGHPEPGKVDCSASQFWACCGTRWAEYPVRWEDAAHNAGHDFEYDVRREVLEQLLRQLLE